jgi:hypothetical protein
MAEPTPTDLECKSALDEMLGELPEVRIGKMFGVPAYYVGKRLFACVFGDAVGIKVPEPLAQELLADPRFSPFQPYGKAKMREWVQFACAPADELEQYRDVLMRSYEFVRESL